MCISQLNRHSWDSTYTTCLFDLNFFVVSNLPYPEIHCRRQYLQKTNQKEHNLTKESLLKLTEHLDKLEITYNTILKEYESRNVVPK
jgi:hypothetical protein